MDAWNKQTLKSLLLPAGGLLFLAVALLEGGFVSISASALEFFYYAVFLAGILLAWRFQSTRILSALVLLLVAHRAMEFFSAGKVVVAGPGRIAFEVIAFLLPLNFVALAFAWERRLSIDSVVPRLSLLFFQSVFVAVLCRPSATTAPALFRVALFGKSLSHWTRVPQPAFLVFLAAFILLAMRFWLYRKPAEAGMLWSLAAVFAGLHAGGVGRLGSAYFAASALILTSSIIENSYTLAYHDELTTLRARRAFNEALPQLSAPYSIAVVDIDHFKKFNDTYGHDTGDQVLRMVAARLARVGGGGQAYRVGGEEFTILFPGKTVKDILPHAEELRRTIADSRFRVRDQSERRTQPRESTDRRDKKSTAGRKKRFAPATPVDGEFSVTVSIGVAEPHPKTQDIAQVIEAADKALYRAKQSGRNRVEVAGALRPRARARRATA
jgi:diguanylate cyclase (GGDEF)-like protein